MNGGYPGYDSNGDTGTTTEVTVYDSGGNEVDSSDDYELGDFVDQNAAPVTLDEFAVVAARQTGAFPAGQQVSVKGPKVPF